jgi:putative NADPH-quinone reductase
MATHPPQSPRKALVLFAHPRRAMSRVNRQLAEAAAGLAQVEVHDLYETYPDFYIDVPAEQARLAACDVVVFLHPIQWYSMPALLKEWVDTVLLAGWAYGEHGHALAGKTYWMVATAGSPEALYAEGATHGRPLNDYLHAFRQTAALCRMDWAEPHILYGAHQVDNAAVQAHVDGFVARLGALLASEHPSPV